MAVIVSNKQNMPDFLNKELTFNSLYTNGFFPLVWYNILGLVHCIYLGMSSYNLKKILYFFLKIIFTFTNSVDPNDSKCHIVQHFVWVFTVCKHTLNYGFTPLQRVNIQNFNSA